MSDNIPPQGRFEVIIDFSVDDGLLTVHLRNIGCRSAYRLTTTFDKPFHGLNGRKLISEMRVFRRLDFMAPGKELSQFVDTLSSYARRKEPLRLKATVSYRDREGNRFEDTIAHDLRVYLELGQARIIKPDKGG
jgi:hypothetical protein